MTFTKNKTQKKIAGRKVEYFIKGNLEVDITSRIHHSIIHDLHSSNYLNDRLNLLCCISKQIPDIPASTLEKRRSIMTSLKITDQQSQLLKLRVSEVSPAFICY